MSDFLCYAARLQDAGVDHLSVSLFTAKDRTRMMMVTPHGSYPQPVQERWPARHFELCGTDRRLESLKDEMTFSDDGVTAEKVQATVAKYPLLADDLREWYAEMLLHPIPTEEEIDAAPVDERDVMRTTQYVKGLLRGVAVNQSIAAQKQGDCDDTD